MNSDIKILKISKSHLSVLMELLYQRNKTIPEYTQWKYGSESPKGFRGVIAFDEKKPIGCFGNVPLEFSHKSNTTIYAGWFADWYVVPEYRNRSVGLTLLNELNQHNPIFFGHPGPKKAVNLCRNAGWEFLSYQSKIIWIFDEWKYYRHRSRNSTRAIIKILKKRIRLISQSLKNKPDLFFENNLDNELMVSHNQDFYNWIINQPAIPEISRNYGSWKKDNLHITYSDQVSPKSKEKYRRVIYINPLEQINKQYLSDFLTNSKLDKLSYVELFTGSPKLRNICSELNGLEIVESPIVYTGFPDKLMIPNLQGLHRENWLFQAAYE